LELAHDPEPVPFRNEEVLEPLEMPKEKVPSSLTSAAKKEKMKKKKKVRAEVAVADPEPKPEPVAEPVAVPEPEF
jgi:hypothetical protein